MSNNTIIPKEQLTAYQRWELAAFDDAGSDAQSVAASAAGGAGAPVGADMASSSAESESTVEPVHESEQAAPANLPYPTAEEMEAIHQQAYQDAFGEGQKAGYEQGFEQGLSEGRQAAATEMQRLVELVAALDRDRTNFENSLADSILDLSLSLTRHMVRQALEVRRDLLVPLVREAINSLPQISQHTRIMVNPADGQLLRELMVADIAHLGLRIIDDPSITHGGCRIETGSSDIDATIESRWQRLLASLGETGGWLGPA